MARPCVRVLARNVSGGRALFDVARSENAKGGVLVLEERRSLDSASITPDVMESAIALQHEVARRGQHGLPISDLVISATA